MHKLLIEKDLDGFSITEARDIWISLDGTLSNLVEARQQVYRQILRFEKSKWLRSEGSGRAKTYFQTNLYKDEFVLAKKSIKPDLKLNTPVQDYSILINERNKFKGELEIVLGEVDEYQSIVSRFPELEKKLTPLHQQTKERAALLLGKVNVLTTVLNTLSAGSKPC